MSSERMEWVEIIEPRTKEHMYANLTTGECVWDPPEGVNVKRTDSSQWWELFDVHTSRFYYYNAASQSTVWHRPMNCDIIPLAKLQTLKQNTDPGDRHDSSAQTMRAVLQQASQKELKNNTKSFKTDSGASRSGVDSNNDLLTSPSGYHRDRITPDGTRASGSEKNSHRYCKHGHSHVGHSGHKHTDSGRSSDSSLSSAHGYRRLQESGNLRVSSGAMPSQRHHGSDSGYRVLQESSSSNNLPAFKYEPLNHSGPPHSASTPQLKKKHASSGGYSQGMSHPHKEQYKNTSMGKQRSFDAYSGSNQMPLARSGSFMSSRVDNSDDSMHEKYFKSVENTPVSRRRNTKTSNQSSSDSSPHSPENSKTNRHTHGDNQFVLKGGEHQCNQITKPNRPSLVSSISLATESLCQPTKSNISSIDRLNYGLEKYNLKCLSNKHNPEATDRYFHDKNFDTDNIEKQSKYIDKLNFEKANDNLTKESIGAKTAYSLDRDASASDADYFKYSSNSRNKTKSDMDSFSKSKHSSGSDSYRQPTHKTGSDNYLSKINSAPYLSKPNLEKHNLEYSKSDIKKNKDKSSAQTKLSLEGLSKEGHKQKYILEHDNGNSTSPLYSNWDLEMQEHLLPLQHYILEQAKLSGYSYSLGDPLDSDSLHSDSQSERSLSGHEPDNEDSDHSGSNDDYLTHHYSSAQDYGAHSVAYYNTTLQISDTKAVDKGSSNQPSSLLSEAESTRLTLDTDSLDAITTPQDQALYSPVQSHSKPPTVMLNTLAVKECDIEQFAHDNLNLHAKGIFRKKSSVRDMLSWTGNAISRPMLALARDKIGKKDAIELFKRVQIYMGDRKARPGMTLNSVAIEIIATAFGNPALRDELYVQLCRQTTENPQRDSLLRGWELLAICLSFIPPSSTFQAALLGYMNRHRDPAFATSFPEVGKWPIHVQVSHYATVACNRLERIGCAGKKQTRRASSDEIDQSRLQIFHPSMFGNTLAEVMELQKLKFPQRKLPWVQVALSEQVLRLNGCQTEGIFRVSADVDEVNSLKSKLDKWELPELNSTMDAHAPASLLKLWYRELYEPLIPDVLYNECVTTESPQRANDIVNRLPTLNRMVLTYLVNFLQLFSQPEVVASTKMDSANLAMVFAPNCLRCTSTDPRVILENARKEMAFMRMLIQHLDTTEVKDIT